MKNVFKKIDGVKTGLFAAGVLFGTAGIKVLASDDAKKLYANCTAAVLRAKKCVMKTSRKMQAIYMQKLRLSMKKEKLQLRQ